MNPELSLIIPTFNESENILKCLENIKRSFSDSKIPYEIIVVDDNSPDRTYEHVKNMSRLYRNIKVYSRKNEKGFGSAVYFGIKKAKGIYLIPFMADLSDDPEDAKALYYKIREGYDAVFTNRFKNKSRAYKYPMLKYFFNRTYNHLVSLVFRIQFTDTSNAFKAFRKDIINDIKMVYGGFEFTTELAVKLYFRGRRFAEMPVSWNNRLKGDHKFKVLRMGMGYISVFLMLLNDKFNGYQKKLDRKSKR